MAIGDDDRLLSYLGLVAMPTFFGGERILGAHLITWLTDPAARGLGVGQKLMGEVVDRYDFLFGRTVTPAALSIYRRFGFRYFTRCRRWLAVLSPEAALALAVEPSEESRKRAFARRIEYKMPSFVQVGDQVPPGATALANLRLADGVAFERTSEFWAWRYVRHPFLRYSFVVLGESTEPEGVAVVRVEDVRGRSGRVLRIVEFLATEAHGRSLAEAVLAYGREHGCAYADLFGMSERFVSGFVAAGAFDAAEEPELGLPHRLQPWDPDLQPPGLLFFGRRSGHDSGGVGPADDISRIYVSKGDGNMDWPSWLPSPDGRSIACPTRLSRDGRSR